MLGFGVGVLLMEKRGGGLLKSQTRQTSPAVTYKLKSLSSQGLPNLLRSLGFQKVTFFTTCKNENPTHTCGRVL